uniref:Uncharacterized protein n=1 Tax=Rhizophora mucronata TaxID=61149 RepID=A0A2P2PCW7_RHIMU
MQKSHIPMISVLFHCFFFLHISSFHSLFYPTFSCVASRGLLFSGVPNSLWHVLPYLISVILLCI